MTTTDVTENGETYSNHDETLVRYKQRFRTIVYGAARETGIDMAVVRRALRTLDVPAMPITPGMVVSAKDQELLVSLPTYTVLTVGDPNDGNFTVFGKPPGGTGGGWTPLFRHTGHRFHGLLTVDTIPGFARATWVDEPATDDDVVLIDSFKTRAWTIGEALRHEQGWCSEYEKVMGEAGIGDFSREGLSMTADQVAVLPQGTIVRWQNEGESVLYVRDDRSTNPAVVERIGGSMGGSWASRSLVVVHAAADPPLPVCFLVVSTREMAGMPVGTQVSEGVTSWTKTGPDEWTPNNRNSTSRHVSDDFAIGTLTYTAVPIEQPERAGA